MHTCPPPNQVLDEWLESYDSVRGPYGHLLLEQKSDTDNDLIARLRPYFESAHMDARDYFHAQIGIDLHPDAGSPGEEACYPNCLPPKALRGLFGEVMAGMLTEAFRDSFVGGHPWRVPIFLFRYHADVEAHLFSLARDERRRREVFGRFGSDFIGVVLDDGGRVSRFIAGEAKWRRQLTDSVFNELMLGELTRDPDTGERTRSGKGVWFELNRDTSVPHGLRQLQRLLEQRDPDGHAAAILSLDEALILDHPRPLPRTNLILIAGNGARRREAGDVLIGWEKLPNEYSAAHDLQVVELILRDGELLIDGLYSSLWT
ncbi:hypothetical protein ABIC03_005468 [Bradyrhizobium sp. RT6a]|uniref:aminotransferase n=1 Tax=unclassified Bradyrhizobium TaxID=2631580 RepID=UPI003391247B